MIHVFPVIDTLVVLSTVNVVAPLPKESSVQVLQGASLQSLSSESVADALKYFSGVQLKDYGGLGGQKTINVRSLGSQHTGIYIDGVRINNTQNGQVDLGKFSLKNYEKVELYNANKVTPLMFASEYASASTVYFTSRIPDSSSVCVEYKYGSFNTHSVSCSFDKSCLGFISADISRTEGNYPFHYKSTYEDTLGYRRNSDVFYSRLESAIQCKGFKFHGYFYYTDRGIPGGVVRRLSDKYGDIGREHNLNWFIQLTHSKGFKDFSLKSCLRYSFDHLRFNSDYPENCFVHYNNWYHQHDTYAAVAFAYDSYPLLFSTSSDCRWSVLDCNVYGLSKINRLDYKVSLFTSYTYNRFKLSSSFLFTHIKDVSQLHVADPLSKCTYSVHSTFDCSSELSIRAFYKQVFRAPTLNDLYYTYVGFRDLKPELTKQFNLGVIFNNSSLNVQLDFYKNFIKDKIICVPQGGSYMWRMINRGFVKINGIDLSLRYTNSYFSIFQSCTWQHSVDLTDKSSVEYGRQLLYSPTWSHSTVLSCFYKCFTLSVSNMFCSKRWWSYASPSDYLKPYDDVDCRLQYQNKGLKVSCSIDNMLNIQHELIQRWPLPARRFSISCAYNF